MRSCRLLLMLIICGLGGCGSAAKADLAAAPGAYYPPTGSDAGSGHLACTAQLSAPRASSARASPASLPPTSYPPNRLRRWSDRRPRRRRTMSSPSTPPAARRSVWTPELLAIEAIPLGGQPAEVDAFTNADLVLVLNPGNDRIHLLDASAPGPTLLRNIALGRTGPSPACARRQLGRGVHQSRHLARPRGGGDRHADPDREPGYPAPPARRHPLRPRRGLPREQSLLPHAPGQDPVGGRRRARTRSPSST